MLLCGQNVLYKPYVQLGDAPTFKAKDQMVIAWQTDESKPNNSAYTTDYGTSTSYGTTMHPIGRIVDNYLAADPSLPGPPTAPGPRVNYAALLTGLDYDTTYFYRVSGPGMPSGGFTASFHTRKKSDTFSFLVMADEGFFPPNGATPNRLANFEARVVHAMYNVQSLSFPGQPSFPKPDLSLNTGDNVYNQGAEGSYRDYWFPVWNSDVDSNQTGAPLIRSIPNYIAVGNHDTGGSGDFVNMLGGDGITGRFNGATEGGDALAYYNNYYFPLNGPTGVDSMYIWNGDAQSSNGWFMTYNNQSYTSTAALNAFRASTNVDAGAGPKNQIDHMSNFSFDSGSAHFLFLDANPHLFNALVDSTPNYAAPFVAFPDYPSILKRWVINDLDASNQPWKIVVFHQPAFSSGNATLRNFQLRAVAKILEDHGVNLVFNGHEHNYQRTLPLRMLPGFADAPSSQLAPVVEIDSKFDGAAKSVRDGVLYVVEGTGGNRDFDGNEPNPRGQGPGQDQEDIATGTYSVSGLTFPNGPASWLDTNLTSAQMSPFLPGAGSGPKITTKFKAKVFGFGDVLVNGNTLTLYQISEPLLSTSSATSSNPFPFGADLNGKPLNDPLPDTLIDPATGQVVTPAADGKPALLDVFTITKPDVSGSLSASVTAPSSVVSGGSVVFQITVENDSPYALNAVQVVVALPNGLEFDGNLDAHTSLQSRVNVVKTIGRLVPGEKRTLRLRARAAEGLATGTTLQVTPVVRSSTAQMVTMSPVSTTVVSFP